MKILIVDDELLVRVSLVRAGRFRGHEVFEAEDGQHGLELWPTLLPDLVYLDVLMPRLSGPELMQKVGPEKFGAKVILMSALTGEYDADKAKELGANMFISKPFDDIFSIIQLGEDLSRGR